MFNGILNDLSRVSDAHTRSISPENFTGEKGKGGMATEGTGSIASRELGQGWKVSPYINLESGETAALADIKGSGAIQHFWITTTRETRLRDLILRYYWDDQSHPSVEVPLGDFFCLGWEDFAAVNSLPVCVNPGKAFNCYWNMPYRTRARITLENRSYNRCMVYYQFTYTEMDIPKECAYFHAQFRRENPTQYKVPFTVLDGVRGKGQYVGTYMAWGVNTSKWWGEGEVKFFLDGDTEFPTICGTGTEDYFCGSFDFDVGAAFPKRKAAYYEYNTPFAGVPQVIRPDGLYNSQQCFGMYRWHIPDPIRFHEDIRVTVQALGWHHHSGNELPRYKPLRDDIASVAFWYQQLPTVPFPELPDRDHLEAVFYDD